MSKRNLIPIGKASLIIALVTLILLFTFSIGYTQVGLTGTGPGGVGAVDGSSTLELWVKADEGAFTDPGCTAGNEASDGNNVQCWQDNSGNGTDLTVSGTAPIYRTGQFNNEPTLEFSGDILQNSFASATNEVFTIFIVSDSNSNPQSEYAGLFSSADGVSEGSFQIDAGGASAGCSGEYRLYLQDINGINITVCSGAYGSNPSITAARGGSLIVNTYQNGLIQGTSTFGGVTPLFEIFALGRNRTNNMLQWNGDIAETIIYFQVLPAVERILVDNYLSAKYDIIISNDHYTGDTALNGDFDLNVAGIGQLNSVTNDQAHSAGMVVVNNNFLNDDGDWLIFGHRTPQNSNTQTNLPTGAPWDTAPNPQMWDRHWFLDVTGASTGDTVDIIFDFSEGEMNACCPPAGPLTNYRLLERTGTTGEFSDMGITATQIVGDQVWFEGVDATTLGSNYTLGTLDYADSPTAVTMQNFSVTTDTMPIVLIGSLLVLALVSIGVVVRRREA